jgi:hypothetical protein
VSEPGLQALLLKRLAGELAPHGYRRHGDSFRRDAGPCRLFLRLAFVDREAAFDVLAEVAVRHHAVEEMLRTGRGLAEHDQQETTTVAAELGALAGAGRRRWAVRERADVEPAVRDLVDWFVRVGGPFLERFASLAETYRVLADDGPEARLVCPEPERRAQIREVARELLERSAV